jgi:hypothetical protein
LDSVSLLGLLLLLLLHVPDEEPLCYYFVL